MSVPSVPAPRRVRGVALLAAGATVGALLGAGCAESRSLEPASVPTSAPVSAPGPADAEGPGARSGALRAGAPDPPGGVALSWSPEYMNDDHVFNKAEARQMAQRFDLVAAMPAAFGSHTAAMRRANPDLTLLTYANATLAQPADVAGLPEAAYAHTTSGRRISAPGFGTYLMESSHPAWRRVALAQCDDRVELSGYDGCLLDMLTLGIFAQGIVTGTPRDPATGRPYTQAAYRAQMTALAKAYRRDRPGLVHAGNSVENAYRYWSSPEAVSRPLVNSQPAAQMEDFLRGARDPATDFPSPDDWLANVRVIEDMDARGTAGLFTTKLWTPASRARTRQWQAYAMASFLLAADGRSYFSFTRSRDKAGVLQRNVPYRMPRGLGAPTGAMSPLRSGAWVRRFAQGRVVVNPTGRRVTVSLGGRWRGLDGRTVSTLRLAPHSGDVLLASSRR